VPFAEFGAFFYFSEEMKIANVSEANGNAGSQRIDFLLT
jgi:hypothetical protein